jgi:RecB family exonuclease
VITPRTTRLVRVPDLHAFRRVIGVVAAESGGDTCVVVPTHSAARQLSRALAIGGTATSGQKPASGITHIVTRDDLYTLLQSRLSDCPRRLTVFERDSLMQAAASTGEGPPFQVRPGLITEMIRFYDQLRRQSQSVKRFHELMEQALGGTAPDIDRGAARLLGQTRFLARTFTAYELKVLDSGACDEHTLRERLVRCEQTFSIARAVVTVPDWIADPDGLFSVDFDLLSRLAGLQSIDLVCTETILGSGFHERLHGWWPGIEEVHASDVAPTASGGSDAKPRLLIPSGAESDAFWFTHRDREEELIAVAGRIPLDAPLGRIAVVFKRPLPYLYLAPDTLGAAGVAYEAADALPLAGEPTASAVDLVLDAVSTNFTRASLVALLRCPHFQCAPALERESIAAFDRLLSEARYLGELSRLQGLTPIAAAAQPAFDAAVAAARQLAPILEPAPASVQLNRVLTFLDAWLTPLDSGDRGLDSAATAISVFNDREARARAALHDREARARAAIRSTLADLAAAHAVHHDPLWSIEDVAGAVRRWIGEQTFVSECDGRGVQLLDDQAARYADLDSITLVGLIENEWPERPRRNIFYTGSLLKALGWPSEKDRRGAAEARFLDLLGSPSRDVVLSTFTLEDEALVTRSMLLDEVPRARLSALALDDDPVRTLMDEQLIAGTFTSTDSLCREWSAVRTGRSSGDEAAFHGSLGAQSSRTWSVSALETYLDCPFKFFAQHVLRLQEEPDDEEVMDPRRQGQFVHDVFEMFFREWQVSGRQTITPDNLNEAAAMFADVVDRALVRLPNAEAGLERTRLLGSSAAAGLGEAVLRMEAERPVAVVERLLEHRLEGTFAIHTESGVRQVTLRGKADRLDLLADGTFRLIDYKLGWPPNRARALQLPIYALCAQQRLRDTRSENWTVSEAAYLAFKGPKRVVPLFTSTTDRDDVLAKAQQRLADTIDAIERGDYPPRPDDVYRCETCSFAAVCRKDYVADL